MSDYKQVFVARVINEDDGQTTVYTTVATTREAAKADAMEAVRGWGDYVLPGEPNSIFDLIVEELNLIEE